MKNYNEIIDIIQTIIEDEEISKSIAVSGSIVPYIIASKESKINHNDFYILVKEKEIKNVRDKIKKLSKEYDFIIESDSIKCNDNDYGFCIKYENTKARFFPYSIINNTFKIKTYSIDYDKDVINLKEKEIKNVNKNIMIRAVKFGDKTLRIASPEYILAQMQTKEIYDIDTYNLLDKLCDESVLKVLKNNICKANIKRASKEIKRSLFKW